METKQYEVVIKLISNQNPCHSGHKIGDEWVFDYFTPAHMCSLAYNTIYPVALALSIGGTFSWQQDPDVITIACPDGDVHNIFELRRRLKK
jgi:uncharacterized repeat protein (TIGR04076 family)